MSNTWNEHVPTDEQVKQTERVQAALCNELNLLAREGISPACILTGLGMTIADLITTQKGNQAVAPWFMAQARMIEGLLGPEA
jgi:hypothetical protein